MEMNPINAMPIGLILSLIGLIGYVISIRPYRPEYPISKNGAIISISMIILGAFISIISIELAFEYLKRMLAG